MPIIFPRDQSTNAGWHSTHLPLDKMAAFSQTTFSNAFSWMKCLVFWLKFHWSLFLRVQFTITQRSFDVYFDLCLNHQVSKHWIHRWFETISQSLWRHYNALLCHWCAARKWLSDWTCYESRQSQFPYYGKYGSWTLFHQQLGVLRLRWAVVSAVNLWFYIQVFVWTFESCSYLTGVMAAKLQWCLSNMNVVYNRLTHEAETKMQPICRHFLMYFLQWKASLVWLQFRWNLFPGIQLTITQHLLR